MDVENFRWLIALARAGSISRLARTHAVAVSTIARRIDALEGALKLRLVDRRRDGIRLTADGQRMLALAQTVVDGVDQLKRAAEALRGVDQERVVVSGTEFVIAEILAPALTQLRARHADLRIDLRSEAAIVSLAGREADLAVRMSRPEGASLLARKLTTFSLGLFAHPDYLAGRDPATLDLARERMLAYDDGFGRLPELDVLKASGLAAQLAYTTNSTRALLTAAAAGAGIALLPTAFARPAGLVQIGGPQMPSRTPYLVVHRDVRRRPAIAATHRWIVETFNVLTVAGAKLR